MHRRAASHGAYVISLTAGVGIPNLIMIASAAMLVCFGAYERLLKEGIRRPGGSMPSWDIFEPNTGVSGQRAAQNVAGSAWPRKASTFGWERMWARKGRVIGMHTFELGAAQELQKNFGFEPDQVVAVAKAFGRPNSLVSWKTVGK